MKRVLTILALLLLPLSVWAMTPVNDSDLSNVTGQAGVNINANLSMDIAIGTMAWGDSDGIKTVFNPWEISGTSTAGGYVGINGFNMTNLVIKARTEADDNYGGYNTLMLKPITIDVATGAVHVQTLSAIPTARGYVVTESLGANTTFVRFGLGALKISLDGMQFDVSLGKRVTTTETAGNQMVTLNQNMGTVSLGNMAIYINPWSYVDIYSASNSATAGNLKGVNFAVNVTVDKFQMEYMSWGDKDGFAYNNASIPNGTAATQQWMNDGTAQTAGYIGLDTLYVGSIAMNGTVQIDVTTSAGGVYNSVPAYVRTLGAGVSGTYTFTPISIATQGDLLVGLWNNSNLTTATLLGATRAGFVAANNATLTGLWTMSGEGTYFDFCTKAFLKYLGTGGVIGSVSQATAETALKGTAVNYYGAATADPAVSVVHISFPTDFMFVIDGPITAAVKIGNTANFKTGGGITTNAATLGDIYLSGMKVDIYQGSWVDIWAH